MAITILLGGCRSVKTVSSSEMSYNQQKTFEKFYFEASKQKILNNQEKALTLFQSALETYPKSDATMYQLARLYYQMDQYNQALYWSEKAVSTSKTYNKWYSGQLAQFYNRFGKYEESAKVFQSMIKEDPGNNENYIEAANQYFNAKKYQESIAVLLAMQSRFGIEEASSTRLEYVYTTMGENEKAIAELEKLSNKYPTNTNFKGYLSDGYLRLNQKEKAIQQLNEIIEIDSNEGFAYYALYNLHQESGDKDLSFYNLKKAFQKDNLDIQQKLQATSSFFLQLKKDNRARDQVLELSDILESKYPNQIEPYILKTDIYATLEDFQSARKYALKAIEVDASDFKSWSKLLSLNAQLNDPRLQIEDTKRAIELFPNMAGLYTARAYALLEVEEYEEAVITVNEGLEVAVEKPDKLELLLCSASCYNKLGNFEKSDAEYEKVLNMSPYNSLAMNNYAYNLAVRKSNLNYADSLINAALVLEPTNPYFMDTKAWVLYSLESYTDALDWLWKAVEIDSSNPEYYEHLYEVYLKLGNSSKADEMAKKVKELTHEK